MLTTPDGQETNKGNLHARKCTQRIPRSIANVKTRAIPPHADKHKRVQRQQVGNEHITTPRRHHVSVEQRGKRTPEHRSVLDRLDPEEEGEHQQEDGNGLVIVTTGHGSRDVTRGDAHEGCGEETSRGRCDHLGGQEVRRERGEAREAWCKEHADVADVDGEREEAEEVVDGAAGDHQTGVKGTTGDSSEGMPCSYKSNAISLVSSIVWTAQCTARALLASEGVPYDHRTSPKSCRTHSAPGTWSPES